MSDLQKDRMADTIMQQDAEIARLTAELAELRAGQDALVRAERNKVRREAADADWATGRDVADHAPEYLTPWQRGLVAGMAAKRDAILAMIEPEGK